MIMAKKVYYDLYNDNYGYVAGYRYENMSKAVAEAAGKCRLHHAVEVTEDEDGKKTYRDLTLEEEQSAWMEWKESADMFYKNLASELHEFLLARGFDLEVKDNEPCHHLDVGIRKNYIPTEVQEAVKEFAVRVDGRYHDWCDDYKDKEHTCYCVWVRKSFNG